MSKVKILRVSTVPIYMNIVLRGQLEILNRRFSVIAATSYDRKHYHEILEREGVEMRKIDLCRTISPIKDIRALFQLVALIKLEAPDVVHTHTPKAGLLGMIASVICRVPIRIHTVTGMPLMSLKGIKRQVLLFFEKLTYSLSTNIYPNSNGLKSFIVKHKLAPENKVKVLLSGSTNGVDINYFDPDLLREKEDLRREYNLQKSDFIFLFVGRLAKEKGIDELVTAFRTLKIDLPQKSIKLILVGKLEMEYGSLTKTTVRLIEEDNDILTPGRFDDVRPFYKIADIFVLPSYREGFPNSVLEAGAMRLSSIVTDINGCNEIITDGINGQIIPARDGVRLGRVMRKLIMSPSKNLSLGIKARDLVVERFSRINMIKALEEEYLLLLSNEGSRKI